MKDRGFLSDTMSRHTIRVNRSQSPAPSAHVETVLLSGSSVCHSQPRAVYPDPEPVSGESHSHCQPVRWVCREISPPYPSCSEQVKPEPGLGRSQTFTVTSQKPPIHDGCRRITAARVKPHPGRQEVLNPSEQTWRNSETSKSNCAGNDPLSPTLDATIENLNNLILELDPTFQPISTHNQGNRFLSSNSRSLDRANEAPLDGHHPGILIYDEWDSGRTSNSQHSITSINDDHQSDSLGIQTTDTSTNPQYHQLPNSSRYNRLDTGHPSSTPSSLPATPGFSRSAGSPHCNSSLGSQSVNTFPGQTGLSSLGPALSSKQQQGTACSAPVSISPHQGSHPIPVPASSSYAAPSAIFMPNAAEQYGTSPAHKSTQRGAATSYLSTSAGSEIILNADHTSHTDSAISLLSTSPAWDTLGSSQSLLSDDGEAGRIYRSTGSTYGSSGSFVNLSSPYTASPGSYKSSVSDQQLHQAPGHPVDYRTVPRSRGKGDHTSQQAAPGSALGKPAVSQVKEHASSCPPSAASSWTDIPILLVNGSTQYLEQNAHKLKNDRHQSGSASTPSLPLNTCSNLRFAKASSTPSLKDLLCEIQPTVKFVQDTSKFWYKPNISRDQAVKMLKDKEPGAFVIRESSTYVGSFGLAMKVSAGDLRNSEETPDSPSDLVRHFLIEFSRKGVCLKGCPQEPYFGSLSALVYQHCITAMSLPCKLRLPDRDCLNDKSEAGSPDSTDSSMSPPRKQSAAYCVLYLSSVNMESLTGPQAVLKAASLTLEKEPRPQPIVVQFKVTDQGITLTDSKRKLFFRRHYSAGSVNHCGLDPLQRKWRKDNEPSRLFAFVAKKPGDSSENVCHLFAEFEQEHSAHFIINLVSKVVLEPYRM
ncbi:tensin-4-like [Stegostoma tigrinum]|uniref:tensin-4-like n=1 Tax=Stegostoma tigrinum TaxID=3053191 RepID=UPI00286FCC61|nr:tensin-4-like [Stegostoma tigrinum]XP_048416276.2 tensin-4-like [Stegostoma tigrinum]